MNRYRDTTKERARSRGRLGACLMIALLAGSALPLLAPPAMADQATPAATSHISGDGDGHVAQCVALVGFNAGGYGTAGVEGLGDNYCRANFWGTYWQDAVSVEPGPGCSLVVSDTIQSPTGRLYSRYLFYCPSGILVGNAVHHRGTPLVCNDWAELVPIHGYAYAAACVARHLLGFGDS